MVMEVLIMIFIVLFGLVLGSFYCCMGYRIPNKISIVKPGSFCPKCKKHLKWYMNIPLFSFIFLRGKCAYCKDKINFIYPTCELATAILFLVAYINFGFSTHFFVAVVISSALIVTAVSDFIYYYVSDRVVLISIILLIIIFYVSYGLNETFYSILSGIGMFLVMSGIKIAGDKVFKKESMGGGDIKLMGVIGISVGFVHSFFVLFFASLFGLLFAFVTIRKNKNGIIPFGPFLIFGALVALYLKDQIEHFINYFIL